jgi:hypothetical protein
MVRNRIHGDFGGTQILDISLVRLRVCKFLGEIDCFGGGSKEDLELWIR